MADKKLYANGTMKVANVNGELVPFYPSIKSEYVSDCITKESLDSIMLNADSSISHIASENDSIQIFNVEPKESIYNNALNNRLFIVMEETSTWELTVKSFYGTTSNNYPSDGYYSAIPFNLYSMTDGQLNIDWGDGTTSSLTKSNYSSYSSRSSMHQYVNDTESTIHKIIITSPDFSKTALITTTYISSTGDLITPLDCFRHTLVSIDSPIPKVKGMYFFSNGTTSISSSSALKTDSFTYLFYDCLELESICSGLFDCNPGIVDFSYTFGLSSTRNTSTKLKCIPLKLFRCNTSANNFNETFFKRAFKTIPEDLFKYTNEKLSLSHVLDCDSSDYMLDSIPFNLFWYNKKIEYLRYMYFNCNEFEIRIGSPNVVAASYFMNISTNANAPVLNPAKRIVYVPNNSETYYTFDSIAEEQKLTIVGV